MDEIDLEGSLILEKLAEIGKLDHFYDAVDSDDFEKAKALMKLAKIDHATICLILQKMYDAD